MQDDLTPQGWLKAIPVWQRGGIIRAFTFVDAEDYEEVASHRWNGVEKRAGLYVVRARVVEGRHRIVYLHRELLGLMRGDPRQGDHMNHDTLDNRRSNLRIATVTQNAQNRRGAQVNSRSGVRGVFWDGLNNKWRITVTVNGKEITRRYGDPGEAKAAAEGLRRVHMAFSEMDRAAPVD